MPYVKPPEIFDAVVAAIVRRLGAYAGGLEFKYVEQNRWWPWVPGAGKSRSIYVYKDNKDVVSCGWDATIITDNALSAAAKDIIVAVKNFNPDKPDAEEPV